MNEQFKFKFIEEATDLISGLEKDLLKLEKKSKDADLINNVFRALHTLKGTGSMFGFDNIGQITHHLENIYGLVRDGKAEMNNAIISLSLDAVDHIKCLLEDSEFKLEKNILNQEIILQQVIQIESSITKDRSQEGFEKKEILIKEKSGINTYYILFQPLGDINVRGINLQAIFDEVELLGKCKIYPRTHDEGDKKSDKKFYMYWEIFLSTAKEIDFIKDVFLFVEDEYEIHILSETDLFNNKEFIEKIEQESDSHKSVNLVAFKDFVQNITGENMENTTEDEETELHFDDNTEKKERQHVAIKGEKASSIRVASEKLDDLMKLVSELVTAKAELNLVAERHSIAELTKVAEKIDKLSKLFRDNALIIRLVPIETMVIRFERLVRDLSQELGKEVDFIKEGTETELDKTIIDSLSDPLLHIIRNSLDHGIEPAQERIKLGKPRRGKVKLTAFYSAANVFIQIQDDGAGMDTNKIKKKAVEKGLIAQDTVMTRKEIYELLFLPGFSTAETVTEVSGRGVGMDVVKQKISNLRGIIEIDSEMGLGSIVTIRLPLTLSIIDTLLVKIGDTHLTIPIAVVDICIEVIYSDLRKKTNKRLLYENELVPFIYLRDEFKINHEAPEIMQAIFVLYKDKKYALIVDEIRGQHQAVYKPLGEMFSYQEMISGGSVLGDGSIAFILDTNKLIIKMLEKQEKSFYKKMF